MGIREPIEAILARLATITELKFVRVFNNQFAQVEEGNIYSFPFPCAFLEVIAPTTYGPLGIGFSDGDIIWRIHLGHEQYDAGSGTFEQNLDVFDIRDKIIRKINLYQAPGCSHLVKVAEAQDYEHTNIYHFMIDFKSAFIDSKGSPIDPLTTDYITKEPPTDLEIDATVEEELEPDFDKQEIII